MVRSIVCLLLLLPCAPYAASQEAPEKADAIVESIALPPTKAEYIRCVSEMTRTATDAMMRDAGGYKPGTVKRDIETLKCYAELMLRETDEERLSGFRKVRELQMIAMESPSVISTVELNTAAGRFLSTIPN